MLIDSQILARKPDANHGYQFDNIGFIDDISIFDDTLEGMQTLLDVVQEFTTWCRST